MQITSNVSNPSFTAKLKNNEVTEALINRMSPIQMKDFRDSLVKLDKVYQNDVLELKKTGSENYPEDKMSFDYYSIFNNTKKTEVKSFVVDTSKNSKDLVAKCKDGDDVKSTVNAFVNKIRDIANPKTNEHKKIFSSKQEIFDMLA